MWYYFGVLLLNIPNLFLLSQLNSEQEHQLSAVFAITLSVFNAASLRHIQYALSRNALQHTLCNQILFGNSLLCCLSLHQSPALRHFSSADPLKTYENRPNTNNHIRALNKLGTGKRLRYGTSLLLVSLLSKLERFDDKGKYHNEQIRPVFSETRQMLFLCFPL